MDKYTEKLKEITICLHMLFCRICSRILVYFYIWKNVTSYWSIPSQL